MATSYEVMLDQILDEETTRPQGPVALVFSALWRLAATVLGAFLGACLAVFMVAVGLLVDSLFDSPVSRYVASTPAGEFIRKGPLQQLTVNQGLTMGGWSGPLLAALLGGAALGAFLGLFGQTRLGSIVGASVGLVFLVFKGALGGGFFGLIVGFVTGAVSPVVFGRQLDLALVLTIGGVAGAVLGVLYELISTGVEVGRNMSKDRS